MEGGKGCGLLRRAWRGVDWWGRQKVVWTAEWDMKGCETGVGDAKGCGVLKGTRSGVDW